MEILKITESKKSDSTLKKLFTTWFLKYFVTNGWKVRPTKFGYIVTADDGETYSIHKTELSVENLFNFLSKKTGIERNKIKHFYKNKIDPFQDKNKN